MDASRRLIYRLIYTRLRALRRSLDKYDKMWRPSNHAWVFGMMRACESEMQLLNQAITRMKLGDMSDGSIPEPVTAAVAITTPKSRLVYREPGRVHGANLSSRP